MRPGTRWGAAAAIGLLAVLLTSTSSAQPGPAEGVAPAGDAHGAATADPMAEVGRGLLVRHGCSSCHSLDGRASAGPTFADRWGGLAAVVVDGKTGPVTFDRAYLVRSLVQPDAEVAVGWRPGIMPAYALDGPTIDAMVAALAAAATMSPDPPATDWQPLVTGLLIFVVGHFLLSAGPIRRPLVARMGEAGFQVGYSIVAAIGIYFIVVGLDVAPYVELWSPAAWTAHVPLAVMPLAVLLWVMGFTSATPTTAGRSGTVDDPGVVRGIIAITRHPALWGFGLWSLSHIPPNGDLARVAFFGGFAALSFGGMWHIDRRRARALGPRWAAFAARTSVLPFAAIASGRARLVFGRGDLIRVVVAAIVYMGLLHTHHLLFGVPPRFG